MMQLPLSVLPAAVPATDASGATGGAATTTTADGDAASVFASLLTAMQATESTDGAAADALGAILVEGETAATTDEGQGDDEIPSGLAALVQSLILPTVTTMTGDQTAATSGVPAEAMPAQASAAATVMTTDVAAGVATTVIETPPATQTEPVAPLPNIDASAPETATPSAPTPTPGLPAELEVPADGATEAKATALEPVATTEPETTVDVTEPSTAEDPVPTETELPEAVATETEPPEADLPEADLPETEAMEPQRPTDAPTGDVAGDEQPQDGRRDQSPLRPDAGQTSNQTTTTAAPVTGETRAAQNAPTAGPVGLPATERPAGVQASTADATANVAAAAVTETAAPTNVERADAPVTIERITLREMPTVVVDRLRAIDPQGGVNRAVVRLDPPELGRIMLEVVSNGDEISVIARADNAEAVRALVRQRAEIEAAVEALGLSMSDFDVKQGDSQRQDAEQETRREGGRYDDRRPAGETGYATTDTPTTEGELFL